MEDALTPFVWVAISLPILVIMQRWIHRHLRGVMLLLTGRSNFALILYFLVLFPGVLLHEISHWLTAGLVGVRTGGFSVWPREYEDGVQLGYVEYYRDGKLGPIRESLIGGAPLIYGTVAVVLIGNHIFDLPTVTTLIQTASIDTLFEAIRQLFTANDALLWLYLLFAISNAMLPSPSDRRAWPGFLLILLIVVALLYLLDLTPLLVDSLTGPIARLFGYLGLAFTITIILDFVVIILLTLAEWVLMMLTGRQINYSSS